MPWRWPWYRGNRDSNGDFSDSVVRLIEAKASVNTETALTAVELDQTMR